MSENKVITLYDLHPQEEIFCNFYLETASPARSAYWAGMLNNIKEMADFDQLTARQIKDLSKMGNIALKKPIVKERISQMAAARAKKYSNSGLDELLQYLTTIMRTSKENLNNIQLMNAAIKAADLLLKRFPADSGQSEADKYNFSRFKAQN